MSRPALSQQTPIPPPPASASFKINPAAALASQSSQPDPNFILSPLLCLPSSFGTLHVGETFTCTLCANNELRPDADNSRSITGVRIAAEMTTPSVLDPFPLELDAAIDQKSNTGVSLAPGETLQGVMRYYLREEGNHVLAVTVTYTEGHPQSATAEAMHPQSPTGGRVRTFRKLYQFAAQSLMGIRTKIRTLPVAAVPNKPRAGGNSFALEAQLENYSDGTIVLDEVEIMPREGMQSKSLNAWDASDHKHTAFECKPTILPGDVVQVAYILSDVAGIQADQMNKMRTEAVGLCQLHVRWRGSMGEEGALTTAWLGGKRR